MGPETHHPSERIDALIEDLRSVWAKLRLETRSNWNRDLPLGELLFDRWQRARDLGFGDGTNIYHNSFVYGDVKVGRDTWIGPFTILDGSGGLRIGDNCSISAGVQIYTHDSVAWATSGGQAQRELAQTTIGSNCYIGPNAIIAKGVNIADGCVVGCNSLVNQSLTSGSRVAGNPAKSIS